MHEVGRPGSQRHFCMSCADANDAGPPRPESALNFSAVFAAIGWFVLVISVFADQFHFGKSPGFGPWQTTGLGIGLVLVLTAAIVRISTLSIIGLCLIGLTLAADWVGFGNADGFGPQQWAGVAVALALLAGAAAVRLGAARVPASQGHLAGGRSGS